MEVHTKLGDFGASFAMPPRRVADLTRMEVRAYGCLVEDLLGVVPEREQGEPGPYEDTVCFLESLAADCMSEAVNGDGELERRHPSFEEIVAVFDKYALFGAQILVNPRSRSRSRPSSPGNSSGGRSTPPSPADIPRFYEAPPTVSRGSPPKRQTSRFFPKKGQ